MSDSDYNHHDKTGPTGQGYAFDSEDQSLDEMVNSARLRQIYQRRDEAFKALSEAGAAVVEYPDLSTEDADVMVESRVRAYAVELRGLMHRAAAGGVVDENYWEAGVEIAAQIAPPPGIEVPDTDADASVYTPREPVINPRGNRTEVPEPVVVGGTGVGVIRQWESPLTLTWQVETESATGQTDRETFSRQTTLPRDFTIQVLEACDEFLGAAGLDMDVQPDMEDVHGDPV